MSAEFSLVSVVLFIALGALICYLLFLFAKRQIMRFALKSARKPHVNIGSDAPKVLREKIHHCLEMTKGLCFDPCLLSEEVQNMAQSGENHYYYRMKALDAFSNAGGTGHWFTINKDCNGDRLSSYIRKLVDLTTLQWSDSSVPRRDAKHTIQLYLYCLCPSAAGSKDAAIIEKFAQAYKHARHSPNIFGKAAFIRYMELLDKIIRLIKLDQKRRSHVMKTVNLEVLVKSGVNSTETLTQTTKVESIPLQPMPRHKNELSPETEDGKARHRDLSSGYSSTDRSSSERGSEERLISNSNENKHV